MLLPQNAKKNIIYMSGIGRILLNKTCRKILFLGHNMTKCINVLRSFLPLFDLFPLSVQRPITIQPPFSLYQQVVTWYNGGTFF